MSKTIRFLGGPADQELRAVPDNVDRVYFCELPADFIEGVLSEVSPDEPAPAIYHIYLEAFPGAAYFKYQGTSVDESGDPERPSFQAGDFIY